jgi:N utilization substance protein A
MLMVSRTHKGFLKRLFELEVPEIHNGTVEIRAIAREAGSRSKVAVSSRQEGLDPVGATVGQRGARVQAVVAELGGEKIDVIPWNDDPAQFVANALSPAQVLSVDIDTEHRIANVTVPERMLSLAIGREGQNARLAARLSGWRIDIRSDVSVAEAKAAEAAGPSVAPEVATTAPDAGLTPAEAPAEPIAATAGTGAETVVEKKPRARPKKAATEPTNGVAEAAIVEAGEPVATATTTAKAKSTTKTARATKAKAPTSKSAAANEPAAEQVASVPEPAIAAKPRTRARKAATEEVAS